MTGPAGTARRKIPIGAFMEKGLTLKTGQTHMQRYTKPLLEMIDEGKIDSTFVISHHASLEQGPEMYKHWHDDQNSYTKIVLKPEMASTKKKGARTEPVTA